LTAENTLLASSVFGFLLAMPENKILPSQRIRGVLAPVVIPFKADLSPDRQRFVRHCQWLLSQNCGLAVFGTNSEANSMSVKERMTLLDALVAAGIRGVLNFAPVVLRLPAGVSLVSVDLAVQLEQLAFLVQLGTAE